jgi:hypothetical protein
MRGACALQCDRVREGGTALEARRRQIARLELRRIRIGDIFREQTLTFLMPLHFGAEHVEDRQSGDGHGGFFEHDKTGKLCRVHG